MAGADDGDVFSKTFEFEIESSVDEEVPPIYSFFKRAHAENISHLFKSTLSVEQLKNLNDILGEKIVDFNNLVLQTLVDVYSLNKVEYNFKKHIKIIDISEDLIRTNSDVSVKLENNSKLLLFSLDQPPNGCR